MSYNPAVGPGCFVGPGRCVCRWAAARPRAVRAASFARRVASKPGQAPPPPTGTAADPSGALRTSGAGSLTCASALRLEARPGPVPRSVPYSQFRMQFPDTCSSSLSEKPGISTITFQSMKCAWGNCMRICADQAPPPPTGTAAWFSGPPMWSGLSCWDFGVLWCVLLQTSSIRGVFRVDFRVVVTNVVNPMAFSLKMVVFGLRLTTFVTGVLARRFNSRWFDDVCNIGRPLVAWPIPAVAMGSAYLALLTRWAGCLKPSSPLRVPAEPRLKPSSPLRVRNGLFWRSFRVQR